MFKKITVSFMVVTIATIMGLGCLKLKNEKDNKDKQALALGLILLNQQGKQVTVPTAVSNAAMSAVQSAAQSGQIGYKDLKDPKFLLAYSKNQFEKKFPYLKLTTLDATSGSCSYNSSTSSFTCNATISGDANCNLGGTVSFNNVQITMNGTFANFAGSGQGGSGNANMQINFSSSMNGKVNFSQCKTMYLDWVSNSQNIVTLNGNVTMNYNTQQKGNLNYTYSGSYPNYTTESNFNGTYQESGTTSISNFSIDGNPIADQSFDTDINIQMQYHSTSNTVYSGSSYSSSVSINGTYNGYVKINGATVVEYNNYAFNEEYICDSSGCY